MTTTGDEETTSHAEPRTADLPMLVAGFACGLLTGAALGLLLAPARGRDTRAWIVARGADARSRTARLLQQHDVMGIVRRSGIRGLAAALRPATPRTAANVTPFTSPQP